ncbi:arsenosugar biosynthesis radical SAM (seleno)protein ArsS [Cyanobium sp. Morenito 9A2]|uniref:arsenosugar biosynthesis radical SAM (seleno)protein ArsS n=1 Tax=Cyanobium sp. Morenito 9A2 TaxID=2823718 RepID=UPI0020CE6C2F|nr:arsenosugar biosynthesis radical SAM (seleno)protein ArsS [Cyanobium sp. Morenito 9A2]MCP9850738.1 arsenosugar biosynthesis radical SAM protein ArsS [Cyanobium sp. Morenito 9A2]
MRRDAALEPTLQRHLLQGALPREVSFASNLSRRALEPPLRGPLRVLQLNLGRLCNMRCHHCHVDAGPDQGATQMGEAVVEQCLAAIERLRPKVVDLTGGAPELHGRFRDLVRAARGQGCHVIDRSNLTVLLLPAMADLGAFLAAQEVEIVASLPDPEAGPTDVQRGEGTWAASIEALRKLNALGYGQGDPARPLTLMSNPAGTRLQQLTACDEQRWKRQLLEAHGVRFDRLIGLNNMPIARFLQQLQRDGLVNDYLKLLQGAFNPGALGGLMCRDTLSVAPDGDLHDCDFNQMLDLPLAGGKPIERTIADLTSGELEGSPIAWGNHCYGCSAGQGSSCAGATAS